MFGNMQLQYMSACVSTHAAQILYNVVIGSKFYFLNSPRQELDFKILEPGSRIKGNVLNKMYSWTFYNSGLLKFSFIPDDPNSLQTVKDSGEQMGTTILIIIIIVFIFKK